MVYRSQSTSKSIVVTIILLVCGVALLVGLGVFISKSSVFDNDFTKDTNILFNPATYKQEALQIDYDEIKANPEEYAESILRFYGRVADIDEPILTGKYTVIINVPKYDKKHKRLVEDTPQLVHMVIDENPKDDKIAVGDFIFAYGEKLEIKSYTTSNKKSMDIPFIEAKVLVLDTDRLNEE